MKSLIPAWTGYRNHLAGVALILALLGCNALQFESYSPAASPTGDNRTAPIPGATPSGEGIKPSSTSVPATPTASPTATPDPAGALEILDTYASLQSVRSKLESMIVIRSADGLALSGRQLLEWLLVERQYNPTASNADKRALLGQLEAYEFPHSGAKIFLINLANGLFAESRRLFPWSLGDYSPDEIGDIFIEDSTLAMFDPGLDRGRIPLDMPNLRTHRYPIDDHVVEQTHAEQFNLARRLTSEAMSQTEAVSQILVWMQQNFFHAVDAYGWEVYLDGRAPLAPGGPVAYPLSLERIYDERVIGCHEPTILLEGMLHSLNIPAVRLKVHGHGVLYLPSLNRYIHGDHVANYTDAPLGVLLLTAEEFRPYAVDVVMIFQIYFDKYKSPLVSMPLVREGEQLFVMTDNMRDFPSTDCLQVSPEDWERLVEQLEPFNIRYDSEACILSSDPVPIMSLDALNHIEG